MILERTSGIILHPTALWGAQGVGHLGEPAHQFVDWLASANQRYWQICPLGPTGYGNSPYQCFSAFAANPLLIDLSELVRHGLLSATEVEAPGTDSSRVNFPKVIELTFDRLRRAHARLEAGGAPELVAQCRDFAEKNAAWLDGYALFMALKREFHDRSWEHWSEELRERRPAALERAQKELASECRFHVFVQCVLARQWEKLKAHANSKGILIVGDLPIYVSYDSADVWSHPELFLLDERRLPRFVAGVPPDLFTTTGQLWGNPIYDWPQHQATGYRWWVNVVGSKLGWYDVLRIDHFRGFAAYWSIAHGAPTAEKGTWEPGPKSELFSALQRGLGSLPILAEDLGVITPDVVAIREAFGFPGMKILQFAFNPAEPLEHRPYGYPAHSFAYTGTHDNDTTRGWYSKLSAAERSYAREYLGLSSDDEIAWEAIRAVWESPSQVAMAPLQDVLNLGSEARFNTPGTSSGNWEWRAKASAVTPELANRLRRLSATYGRGGDPLGRVRPTSGSKS